MSDMQDAYEDAVEEAIALCGGTPHGAIKALIMANEYLEAQLRAMQIAVRDNLSPTSTVH
jgi:electron transfer flavoprotein alpha/beta subunit